MNKIFSIHMRTRNYWPTCFLIAAFIFTISSCVKQNVSVSPNGPLVYVAPQSNTTSPYDTLVNNFLIFRDSITSITAGISMAFPVKILLPYTQDIILTAKIDTTLLAIYNRLSGSSASVLPYGAFRLIDSITTIKAGSTISADSIKLILQDTSRLNLTGTQTNYVVPVRINSTISGLLLRTDTLRQTMFFQVSFTRVLSSISAGGDSIIYMQLVNQTDGTFLQNSTGFGSAINTAIDSNLTVNIMAVPSLVAGFNVANNTSYGAIPVNGYNVTQSSAIIPVGTTISSNNYNIQFLTPLSSGNYLLPLSIKNEGIVPPGQNNTVYITAVVEPETIYARANWQIISVSAADTADGLSASNVLDGDYNTNWVSSATAGAAIPPQWFTVDMGQVNPVKGIMFRHANSTLDYEPNQAKVYTSMDNVHWDAGQAMTIPALPTPNKNFFIDLPASVQARYIKFEVESTQSSPSSGVTVAEFGVY